MGSCLEPVRVRCSKYQIIMKTLMQEVFGKGGQKKPKTKNRGDYWPTDVKGYGTQQLRGGRG